MRLGGQALDSLPGVKLARISSTVAHLARRPTSEKGCPSVSARHGVMGMGMAGEGMWVHRAPSRGSFTQLSTPLGPAHLADDMTIPAAQSTINITNERRNWDAQVISRSSLHRAKAMIPRSVGQGFVGGRLNTPGWGRLAVARALPRAPALSFGQLDGETFYR